MRISVAHGDGIGPEIMHSVLSILAEAGADISPEPIHIGESVYQQGISSGITEEAWQSIRATKVLLKAPLTTPQGGGMKSINVTLRKSLGLFANVRPCVSYHPFVKTKHPRMDVVIIRENEEDLYGGIEHRQTDQVVQCLKLISQPGCERIVRYAFEYARRNGRKKVSCFSKDNIMKLTDGLFHRMFEQIAPEYPEIATEHLIIDIGSARIADTPENFDVVVTTNLYGDILSDIAAQITGSVGLAGSANIGEHCAMFEAIHGSAPQIAGRGIANPSGLLLSAVQMLVHIGQNDVAERIHNALLKTLEDGIHTPDIASPSTTRQEVSTTQFTKEIISRLGQQPTTLATASYPASQERLDPRTLLRSHPRQEKTLVGVDVFLHSVDSPELIASRVEEACVEGLTLTMITNRGVKVWPDPLPETFCTDHWRCRFETTDGAISSETVIALLTALYRAGLDFIKTEHLYLFDGVAGFSRGQGQ